MSAPIAFNCSITPENFVTSPPALLNTFLSSSNPFSASMLASLVNFSCLKRSSSVVSLDPLPPLPPSPPFGIVFGPTAARCETSVPATAAAFGTLFLFSPVPVVV